jgi:hypothetical protein
MNSVATKNARLLAAAQRRAIDPEVLNVEREAYAVECEAFALERENGGFAPGEPTLQDLLTAARVMVETEEDGFPVVEATWQELLTALQIAKDLCEDLLQSQPLDEDQNKLLTSTYEDLVALQDNIERQIRGPRIARKNPKKTPRVAKRAGGPKQPA